MQYSGQRCGYKDQLVRGLHTFVMTVCPPWLATKSFTFEGAATARWLPPMKCAGRLYWVALLLEVPFLVRSVVEMPIMCGRVQAEEESREEDEVYSDYLSE
jgi:hypothetical protein